MKAKLIKKKEGWYNLYRDNIGIGSTHAELQGYKLSPKNCQDIEKEQQAGKDVWFAYDVEIQLRNDFSIRSCSTCCFYTDGKCDLEMTECVSQTNNDSHGDWWASKMDEEEDSELYRPVLDAYGCIILKSDNESKTS